MTYPAFAVGYPSSFAVYSGQSSYQDANLTANITKYGNYWKLSITNTGSAISNVWFPWEPDHWTLGPDTSKDIVFTPELGGVAHHADSLTEFGWTGYLYPGPSHAPYVITANSTQARIVAATNWPPVPVTPLCSYQRVGLRYEDGIPTDGSATYISMIAMAGGWQSAVDLYRTWLQDQMGPVNYTPFMRNCNGWLSVNLQNEPEYDPSYVSGLWTNFGAAFPWIQYWGQMSNYVGPPEAAVPPLLPGEETGCCLVQPTFHTRYMPTIVSFTDTVLSQGGHVGYYSRPQEIGGGVEGPLDDPTNASFFEGWIASNTTTYHANAYYFDTLGRLYYGKPAALLNLWKTAFPSDVVIEGAVDMYPTSYLFSGFFTVPGLTSGPGATLDGLGGSYTEMSFPRLARYLLNDRVVFLGGTNTDYQNWGSSHDYWTERQAFLTGAKIDVFQAFEDGQPTVLNYALAQIVQLRSQYAWWARNPVYQDDSGITQMTSGIDVRRFTDDSGVQLFAIDNWSKISGASFKYNGKTYKVSRNQLSICTVFGRK